MEQNLRACLQGAGTSFQGGQNARQPQTEAAKQRERARHANLWRGMRSSEKRKKRNSHCGLARKWLFFSFEAGMKCSLHAYPVEMRFSGEADGIL